jgi:hypothetical protein
VSRFSGGHQSFASGVTLRREQPPVQAVTAIGPYRATVELVALSGGRPELFDVCARWIHPVTGSSSTSRQVQGGEPARRYFAELADALHRPGPDDAVLRAAVGAGESW